MYTPTPTLDAPPRVIRNCLSGGKYGLAHDESPADLQTGKDNAIRTSFKAEIRGHQTTTTPHHSHVGHLNTRLSPAITNSSGVRMPFSLNADSFKTGMKYSATPCKNRAAMTCSSQNTMHTGYSGAKGGGRTVDRRDKHAKHKPKRRHTPSRHVMTPKLSGELFPQGYVCTHNSCPAALQSRTRQRVG
jgi:hypothetical protein